MHVEVLVIACCDQSATVNVFSSFPLASCWVGAEVLQQAAEL